MRDISVNETSSLPINVFEIPITDITGNEEIKKNKVITLQQSIEAIGLQAPISVVQYAGKFSIMDGNRRLQACKNLGHEKIRCIVHIF